MKFSFFVGSLLISTAILVGSDTTSIPVAFASGKSSTTVHGSIKGYESIDYQIQGSAGQKLSVSMSSNHLSNGFNVYAPDSDGTAMFVDGGNGHNYSGILPNDGVYVVRIYLVRSAARRNETAKFGLSIKVDGKVLSPIPSNKDAVVQGTPYHATAPIECKPPYKSATQCDAMVIRRSHDGTATVVIKKETMTRQILFVKGSPVASDTFVPMSIQKDSTRDTIKVLFDKDESYTIPQALVFGG